MEKGIPIYLDYNATTPHAPEVIEAIRPFLEEHFGNPSSAYSYGIKTKDAVEEARDRVSLLLNCEAREIVFTSGGTESNNYAIRGTVLVRPENGNHIITSEIEHPAIIEVCKHLENEGFLITYLPVDECGMISVDNVEKAITPKTILITIMHANNEVGTIQPIEKIARLAAKNEITFHTDAAQSVGKIPTDIETLDVDLLSIAGHKVYAPKGVGALYIRNGIKLKQLIYGAGQESGWRPGTENVMEVVGLGKACEIAKRDLEKTAEHLQQMRDRLFEGLKNNIENIRINGHPELRLPNTLSVSFHDVTADALLAAVQDRVAVSAGAACHSGAVEMSSVLKAMRVPEDWARGTIRFSVGRMTTADQIDEVVRVFSAAVSKQAAQH